MGRIIDLPRLPRLRRASRHRAPCCQPCSRPTATPRAVGKWHLTPEDESHLGARRHRWPLGRGFERFYGFFPGEVHQFVPALVHDNHIVEPPGSCEDGYHLTADLVDHAIGYVEDLRNVDVDRPWFLYLATGVLPTSAGRVDRPPRPLRRRVGRLAVRPRPSGRLRAAACAHGAVAPAGLGAGVGLAVGRRAPGVRPVHGGLRRVPLPHRCRARPPVRSLAEMNELDDTLVVVLSDNGASWRVVRWGRSTTSGRGTSCPRASRKPPPGSTRSVVPASTTTTVGVDGGGQHPVPALTGDARGRRGRPAHRALAPGDRSTR